MESVPISEAEERKLTTFMKNSLQDQSKQKAEDEISFTSSESEKPPSKIPVK